MQKLLKSARILCPGLLCGALAVWLSCLLVRHLSALPVWAGGAIGLDQETIAYAEQVLMQLRTAKLAPCCMPVLLAGMLSGAGVMRIRRKWAAGCLWLLLLAVLTALSLWLIEINGIRLGTALTCLFPLIGQLL